MKWIDWVFVALPIALVLGAALYTRRYVRSVADFLAAGRCAGRYLLANSKGEAESGLANSLARFEIVLVSGFVLAFWEKIYIPVVLLIGITGFVIYRYRETRAMTLAQFFEMRYSRRFRLFMGGLAFLSGILNYGIFPAVSAHFFIYFLNLPHAVHLGPVAVPTFALIMLAYLSCTVFMILVGGQVTLMVTDCLEGLLSHLIYVVIAVAVFFIVSWTQIVQVMEHAPPGKSLINPFDAGDVPDFNIWFIAMGLFIRIYTTNAFQARQGFNAAARTPHEARMGGILGEWRGYARTLMLLVLAICALAYLNHPAFAQQAAPIHSAIASIPQDYLQKQMTVPIALRYLLPAGIKGLFCAIMIMGLLAGDAGHLHSWGSILVQDVILPLRRKAMSPAQHIWALRLAIAGVALFAFTFSLTFPQTQYIVLWWGLTGALFTGGAGAAIIGGLYWRKGTTGAAWAATIIGSLLSVLGIVCGSFWPDVTHLLGPLLGPLGVTLPAKFWFNGMVSAFLAQLAAALTYLVVAWVTCRRPFNLDEMLHRGRYAVASDDDRVPPVSLRQRFTFQNIFRFDDNFTFTDKLTAAGIFWWAMALLGLNIVVTVWNLGFARWPVSWWAHYWMVTGIALPCVIALGTLVWFGIGGIRDLLAFFAALRTLTRDARDDGRVAGHHNLADEPARSQPSPSSAEGEATAAPTPAAAPAAS